MISNNKSIVQEIVPGILIKTKIGIKNIGYFGNNIDNYTKTKLEDHLYILTEIETKNGKDDNLVFYGLTEGQFVSVYRLHFENYIINGTIDIVA